MRACLILLALLVPLPCAAVAVGDDPPRPKRKKEFDFGEPEKPAVPTGPSAQPPPTSPAPTLPSDPEAAAIQKEIAALATWPAREGVRAAESLLLRGPAAVSALVEVLAGDAKAVQPGAAWVLGRVGEASHVVPVLKAAAHLNGYRADVFFEAASALEPERTKEWLISFLSLDRAQLREESTRYLLRVVGAADAQRVVQLTDSPKAGARIAGLRLLEAVKAVDLEDRMTHALSDVTPAVARTAAGLLAHRAQGPETARLNALAREGEARERAYAVVALADLARLRVSNPFEPATVQDLTGRRGLLHPEKLNRVAAAVGLAYGALDATDPDLARLVDTTVVDVLVEGVGGEHFRDFESLAEPVFGALRRLSAQDLPSNAVEWAKWWQREQGQFHARRELKALTDADLPVAWVRYEAVGPDGSRRSALFVPEGAVKPGAYRLPRETFLSLAGSLEDVGIFAGRPAGRPRADEHVSVTLGVRTQESRVVLAPDKDAPTPRFEVLRARFESLEEANVWQRYRDVDAWPDEKAWREAAGAEMAQAAPDVRADLIRSAVVNAWDDLADDEARNEALDRLDRLGAGLTGVQARLLIRAALAAKTLAETEMRAVGLALAAVPDAETRAAAVEALSARNEPAAVDLLAGLLAQGGEEPVRAAFADARAPVRQAAARAAMFVLGRTDPTLDAAAAQATVDRLKPGLEVLRKDEVGVRIAALLALVQLGDETVVPELETLYSGGDAGLKVRVTEALGSVPGERAHGLLTRILAEPGDQAAILRGAALRSMARTNHPNAVGLLRYYLLTDVVEVQKAAGDALVDLGSDDARFAVVTALTTGEKDARRRARLVDVLGRFPGQVAEDALQRALDDPEPEVQAAAALRAGEKGLAAAVPTLVGLLRGRGSDADRERALQVLEELTCQRIASPGYGEKADAYEAWWSASKAGTDRTWFRDALQAHGYDVGPLLTYVRGDSGWAGAPLLLRVLRDGDPSLRNGAARALERLAGRSFGGVGRGVPAAQAARVAQAWSDWWEQEGRTLASPR